MAFEFVQVTWNRFKKIRKKYFYLVLDKRNYLEQKIYPCSDIQSMAYFCKLIGKDGYDIVTFDTCKHLHDHVKYGYPTLLIQINNKEYSKEIMNVV